METVNAMYTNETAAMNMPMVGLLTLLIAAQTNGTSAQSGSSPNAAALYTAVTALVPAQV